MFKRLRSWLPREQPSERERLDDLFARDGLIDDADFSAELTEAKRDGARRFEKLRRQ